MSVVHIKQITRYEVTCDDHGLIGQYEHRVDATAARAQHRLNSHDRDAALARAKAASAPRPTAEEKVTDLMQALHDSVVAAKESRNRHVANIAEPET